MKRRIALLVSSGLFAWLMAGGMAYAGPPGAPVRLADMEGGSGGPTIDLSVRQVSFNPARAYVGDTIEIVVIVEDRFGEGNKTIPARIKANGKEVAGRLFTFGTMQGDWIRREVFRWDTRGAAPGEYRIQADFYVWEDMSPFDNQMTVTQPLILVPPGAPFPDGQAPGGKATEKDPRFKKDLPEE